MTPSPESISIVATVIIADIMLPLRYDGKSVIAKKVVKVVMHSMMSQQHQLTGVDNLLNHENPMTLGLDLDQLQSNYEQVDS